MKKSHIAAVIGIIVGVVALIGVMLVVTAQGSPQTASPSPSAASPTPSTVPVPQQGELVRENSHVLDDAGEGAPVLVEFLDFECEACGQLYPIIEEIRKQYAGQFTYIVRYFPTGHANSVNAALAAEAAAEQGKFEEMYNKLFDTQASWGEGSESRADLFRSYAEELGLDMAKYDAKVADPTTVERIAADQNDGLALGVKGTPTIFLANRQLELVSVEKLIADLEAAIAASK